MKIFAFENMLLFAEKKDHSQTFLKANILLEYNTEKHINLKCTAWKKKRRHPRNNPHLDWR